MVVAEGFRREVVVLVIRVRVPAITPNRRVVSVDEEGKMQVRILPFFGSPRDVAQRQSVPANLKYGRVVITGAQRFCTP